MESKPRGFTQEQAERSRGIETIRRHFEHSQFLDRENRIPKIHALMKPAEIAALASRLDALKADGAKQQAVMDAIIEARDAMGDKGLQIYDSFGN